MNIEGIGNSAQLCAYAMHILSLATDQAIVSLQEFKAMFEHENRRKTLRARARKWSKG